MRYATISAARRTTSASLLIAVLTASAISRAQDAPPEKDQSPPEPDTGSLPTGGAGAVIVPQPGQPQAPAKVTMPKLAKYAPPVYPEEARKAGIEGAVTLKLDIDKNGRVIKAVVEAPGGHGFDEAALAAAPNLEFEPARRADGTPFPARILYRYSFTLAPAPAETQKPPADIDTITGTVMAKVGDAPIAGAEVSLVDPSGKKASATTDANGKFVFKNLPPGSYRLEIKASGFAAFDATEEVAKDEAIDVKYRLSIPAAAAAAPSGEIEVTVRGERPAREVTRRTIEKREIDRIPGTGGDALRAVQNLPGFARSTFGLLIVRGSAPQDTLTFIDRTPVPIIYHFGGLASVVPTEMLEKIDFYPGNYSAAYGRAMGGIVDVGLRSPKQDGKYHGVAQFDLIDGRLVLEGPIPFVKKDWTFLAGGRRSWVDAWLGPVLEATGSNVTQAPVYYDYQFLVEGRITPRDRVRASFYGSDDAFEILLDEPPEGEPGLTGDFGLHTAFQRFQVSYEHRFSDKDRLTWSAAFGRDNIDFQAGPIYFLIESTSLDLRLELSKKLARWVTLNAGVDINGGVALVKLRVPAPSLAGHPEGSPFSTRPFRDFEYDSSFSRPAAYAEAEIVPSARARIVPGVRVDYSFDSDKVDVSPRVNGRYDIVKEYPRTTVKGGVGLYYQPPQYQEVIEPFGTAGVKSNRSVHYGLGVEQEITKQLEVSVDGFYKDLDDLVVSTPRLGGQEYANDGIGYATGGELLLKYKPDDRFFGWAAYTLSRSARQDAPDEEEYLSSFDQTHVLTVLGSVQLGRGWEVGARFRLVSGNLVTPIVCNPEEPGCIANRLNAIYHAPSTEYAPLAFGSDNSERLPFFHQLDLRMDKTWKFKSWKLSFYLDIQNVYNHGNAEGISYNFNYTKREYVTGLPFLPSIGLRGEL